MVRFAFPIALFRRIQQPVTAAVFSQAEPRSLRNHQIVSSTIAYNRSGDVGGGISIESGSSSSLVIYNSIVATNSDSGSAPDLDLSRLAGDFELGIEPDRRQHRNELIRITNGRQLRQSDRCVRPRCRHHRSDARSAWFSRRRNGITFLARWKSQPSTQALPCCWVERRAINVGHLSCGYSAVRPTSARSRLSRLANRSLLLTRMQMS